MKNAIVLFFAVLGIVFLTSMIMNHPSAQSSLPSQKEGIVGQPIPLNVMKIAERSCVKCHSEDGKKMALMRLDLSNWDSYSPEKQARKAKAMCKMVSKGKMPPKRFRERHPDSIPTKDEVKIICDWANSIQIAK